MSTRDVEGPTIGPSLDAPATWDAPTTLAALAANRRAKNLAEARDLVLVTRYCELNATPDEVAVDGRAVVPGSERMIQPGGIGTPRVREFAVADVSARMHRSHDATRAFIADALDLRYRLPRIWQRLTAGEIEIWRARGVARATRHLSVDAALVVDAEVAQIVDAIGPRRLDRVVQAAVIAADPEDAAQTVRDRDDRQVQVLPSVRHGRKDIFIRADVADVIRFDAAVDFVADLLGADGAVESKEIRRSRAVGVIADPNAVLDLFARTRTMDSGCRSGPRRQPPNGPRRSGRDREAETAQWADTDDEGGTLRGPEAFADRDPCASLLDRREPRIDEGDAVADFDPDAWSPQLQAAIDAFEAAGWRPIDRADPAPIRWWARPGPGLAADGGDGPCDDGGRDDRGRDADRQFPTLRVVVHMNQSTFWWDTRDPCRVEDPGNPGAPITAEQAFELLGHSRVTIQPVLDLNSMAPVDGYEVRGRLRQTVVMKSAGACPFPHCDTFSRHQQCDHTINWPRGPSGVGNLAVADTTHHRVKTHSRWQVRQPFPGMYVWKDPHGQCYVVDHQGTRDVPLGEAA